MAEGQNHCGANIKGLYKEIRFTKEEIILIRNGLSLYNKVIKEHYQKARTRYMKNKWHKTELKIKEIKERIDKKYE